MRDTQTLLLRLKEMGCEEDRLGMARFGINAEHAYGIRIPALRRMAKELGRSHALAMNLWASGMHEARILASMVADPAATDEPFAASWVADFNSWDLCDQCCMNLFWKAPWSWDAAARWPVAEAQFARRAGFALMAALAFKHKQARDTLYLPFFPIMERYAGDGRNYVKKAVNWALRQAGKRNQILRDEALACARRMAAQPSASARWAAADAIRELESAAVRRRLGLPA